MLDIGALEFLVIAVVALVVIGPKELPGTLRTVMGWMRQARGLASEFRASVADMARETGVEELKRDVQDSIERETAPLTADFDQIKRDFDVTKGEFENQIAPPGEPLLDPAVVDFPGSPEEGAEAPVVDSGDGGEVKPVPTEDTPKAGAAGG
jgi:sec-independent protein translocase protein TatB